MDRRIAGFHQDEESFWVAELECGHQQHVRHNPPMTLRPWLRNAFIDAEENLESQKNISQKYLRLRSKQFLLESLVQKQTTAYRINP